MEETQATVDEQDRALVGRYLKGHSDAAAALVDRYQQRLFNVTLRMLGNLQAAEAVTQTVFTNAFQQAHTYDPTYSFAGWDRQLAVT